MRAENAGRMTGASDLHFERFFAEHLEDGTPVFVSHPEAGPLLVLDATSPHQGNKLVAYCGSSALFEDLYHGSRFTGWGDWIAGRAPPG
jgi:hypothetical protein